MIARSRSMTGNNKRVAQRPPSLHESVRRRGGSLLLEAIIGIGVFSLFLAGIGLSLILGERSTVAGGDRTRAAFIAEEQLEAVRQMRNTDYDSVTTGEHGLALSASGWGWSGSTVIRNGYTSKVNVEEVSTDWLRVTSNVSWDFGKTRSGSVLLETYITNWRKIATVGDWSSITKIGELTASDSPDFQKIAVSGEYAYVVGTQVSGGKGLYVYDISIPSSPLRVASTFDLGTSAYGLAIYADRLYLATDDPTAEVKVYDITDPTTLDPVTSLVNNFDLPGTAGARAIAVYGSSVFVGTVDDGTNPQFYSIAMSETGPMVQDGSIGMSGSVLSISLQDGYAYAATANNAAELQVADIFDPENIVFAPGEGIDITDVQDANIVALTGTSALVGRKSGSTIDELILYDIGWSPVPNPPPGPWTLETGGDVNDIAVMFGGNYVFSGGSKDGTQLLVLDLVKFSQGLTPTVASYDTAATLFGLAYDWQVDRLFAISTDSVFVFAPAP